MLVPAWAFINYHEELTQMQGMKFLLYSMPALIGLLWLLGINDFLNHELKENAKENNGLIVILGALYGLVILLTGYLQVYTDMELAILSESKWAGLIIQSISVPFAVLLVMKTRRYMYARSLWWLILEVVFPIVGILTLTSALKEEKAELEMEKKESI